MSFLRITFMILVEENKTGDEWMVNMVSNLPFLIDDSRLKTDKKRMKNYSKNTKTFILRQEKKICRKIKLKEKKYQRKNFNFNV